MNGAGLNNCWSDRLALQGLQTMEIRQLRYFLDIAQTEHLTDSARISAWVWVTEGKANLPKGSKGRLRLDGEGIAFAGKKLRAEHIA